MKNEKLNVYLPKENKMDRIEKIYSGKNISNSNNSSRITSQYRNNNVTHISLPKALSVYNNEISQMKFFNQNNSNSFNQNTLLNFSQNFTLNDTNKLEDLANKEKYDFYDAYNFETFLQNFDYVTDDRLIGLKKNSKNDYEKRLTKLTSQDQDNINNEEVYYDKFDDLNVENFEEMLEMEDQNLLKNGFGIVNDYKFELNKKTTLKEVTEVHELEESNDISNFIINNQKEIKLQENIEEEISINNKLKRANFIIEDKVFEAKDKNKYNYNNLSYQSFPSYSGIENQSEMKKEEFVINENKENSNKMLNISDKSLSSIENFEYEN